MKKYIAAALGAAALLASSAASAAVVTVTENGAIIASWLQSLDPTPTSYSVSAGYTFVPVSGSSGLDGATSVNWYTPAAGGGLSSYAADINIADLLSATSTTPFSGPVSAPIFALGVYYGTEEFNTGLGTVPTTVTISVPEPATWAMMLVGLGMIGFAARHRRTVRVNYG